HCVLLPASSTTPACLCDVPSTDPFELLPDPAEAAQDQPLRAAGRAWASYYIGGAQGARAVPHAALRELRAARETFESSGDEWMVVECMDWQAAALHLLEEKAALPTAEAALEACRRLHLANQALEARLLGRLGAIHTAQH